MSQAMVSKATKNSRRHRQYHTWPKMNSFVFYLKYLLNSDNPSNITHNKWAGQQGSKNDHKQLPF